MHSVSHDGHTQDALNPTVTDSNPSMLYIGGYVMKNEPVAAAAAGNSARSAAGYVAMVAVYLNAFIICATWQGISWTGTLHSTSLQLIPDLYLTSPHSCL